MKRILETIKEKWPEYLLEIFVITFGIMGAFLLNNWNDNVKHQNEQQKIVDNLHEEFKTNLQSLDGQIFRLTKKVKASRQAYSLIHPSKVITDTIDVDALVMKLYDNPTWNPSTYVLSDLTNSGQLKSLKNERLKELLHQWEKHYENLREWYSLEIQMYDKFIQLMDKHGTARNMLFKGGFGQSQFEGNNRELFRLKAFENHLSHSMMITGGLLNIYENETYPLVKEIIEETD